MRFDAKRRQISAIADDNSSTPSRLRLIVRLLHVTSKRQQRTAPGLSSAGCAYDLRFWKKAEVT